MQPFWLGFLLVLALAGAGWDLPRSVGVQVHGELLEPLDVLRLPPKRLDDRTFLSEVPLLRKFIVTFPTWLPSFAPKKPL